MLTGLSSKVLDFALLPPNGHASEQEAPRPEVILAAAGAAASLNRAELADDLVNRLPDGVDKQYAVLLREVPSGNLESDRNRWSALLNRLDESRPERLVQAVMRLAGLGVDRSARLDTLAATGMIGPDVQALAQATAAAVRDLSTGLPALRVLFGTDNMAAARMTSLWPPPSALTTRGRRRRPLTYVLAIPGSPGRGRHVLDAVLATQRSRRGRQRSPCPVEP